MTLVIIAGDEFLSAEEGGRFLIVQVTLAKEAGLPNSVRLARCDQQATGSQRSSPGLLLWPSSKYCDQINALG
jgi:hypothetical protein